MAGNNPENINITETLENIAELIVLCDEKDYKALADLHTMFEQVKEWAVYEENDSVKSLSEKINDMLESIILENSSDPSADFENISLAVNGLQPVIRGEKTIFEADLPEVFGQGTRAKAGAMNLPVHVDEDIFEDFVSRQPSVLEDMEEYLLNLESNPEDEGQVGALKRLIHTMKGDSALVGLTEVEKICHRAEDVMGEVPISGMVDVLLEAKDWLGKYFGSLTGKGEKPSSINTILIKLEKVEKGEYEAGERDVDEQPEPEPEEADAVVEEAAPEPVQQEVVVAPEPKAEPEPEIEVEAEPEEIVLDGDLELTGEFVTEATEHLDNADVHLLSIETNPQDEEALNAVFRAFHTIKGVAGFLKLDEIGALAHEAENLLDKARKGDIILEGDAIDVTFDSVDSLKLLVGNLADALASGGQLYTSPKVNKLIRKIQKVMAGEELEAAEKDTTVFKEGTKVGEILLDEGITTEGEIENALSKQHQYEQPKKIGQILAEDNVVSSVKVDKAVEAQKEAPGGKLGQILVEQGVVTEENLQHALEKQKQSPKTAKLGEILVKEKAVSAHDVAKAIRGQKAAVSKQQIVKVKETVKVESERLDRLLDLIGELVIAESMVTQSEELKGKVSAHFSRQIRHLDKITRELQEMGTSLRMVPVRPVFQKMARLVRDLCRKSGKSVEFVMKGEDTELDKTVVDKIGDPLVHMVRNAIDHGIEAKPEDREKTGKSRKGTVELRAFHKGGSIYIEIEDDGRGLNKDAILKKALERGVIQEGEQLNEKEIFNLIFAPGFSTAQKITDVSGRGVGMDVVRKNIEALRGQVEIRSEEGKGSVFTLRLPLTLAIIDGMVVRVGEERYIIPTLSVTRSIKPNAEDLNTVVGRGEMLRVQGNLITLFRLNQLFDIGTATKAATDAIVVVVEDEGKQVGILVDDLLGQQQIVIKSLGESLKSIKGLSGGAIMPDGRVGLIIDVGGLVQLANKKDDSSKQSEGKEEN